MKTQFLAMAILCYLSNGCTNSRQKTTMGNSIRTDKEYFMLVGSYCNVENEGVKLYNFDQITGEYEYLYGMKGIDNPSYLAVSENEKLIFAVGESGEGQSTVNSISLNKEKATLTLLHTAETKGADPCFISCNSANHKIMTANYTGGSVSVFDYDDKGILLLDTLFTFDGKGPNKERQEKAHIHSVNVSPDHQFMLATDLGSDKIYVYGIAENANEMFIDNKRMASIGIKPGSGPRHLCFHPNQKYVYLINELSGEVHIFTYHKGKLKLIQTVMADEANAQGSADIHITPNGEYLYTSHRLKNDGIAIFNVDPAKGTLCKTGYQRTGKHPRNFAISPNGKFLLVACRDTNEIEIYRINPHSGKLIKTEEVIKTSQPVCIKFITKSLQ